MEKWPLPEGWQWYPLKKIAPAKAEKIRPADYPTHNFRYLGLADIPSGGWTEPKITPVKGVEVRSSCIQFDTRHVLYSKLRPYLNKVVVPTSKGVASTELVPLVPDQSRIIREFLAWYLRCPRFVNYATQSSTGARMPRIRMSSLWSALVPVPPLVTQRHIVARIEGLFAELGAARRLHAALVHDAERLMDAALAKTFYDPLVEIPQGWKVVSVSDICAKPQYGYTQSATEEPVGPKFLRITDIQNGQVNWNTVPYCECDKDDIEKYRLEPEDLVFARSGATTGKTFLVKAPPKAVFASYLIRLQVIKAALPKYVYWFFQSPYYWTQIQPRGAAQPNVNARVLGSLKVPIPLEDEVQHRIVAYLDEVQAHAAELQRTAEAIAADLDRLEQSILAEAFRGTL